MKKLLASSAIALSAVFASTQLQAAGFHLSEYTTTGLGRSFAGLGVVGDDYSAIGFNPAGMQYNEKSGGQAGLTVVSLHSDYKGSIKTAATVDANGIPHPGTRSGSGHTRPTRALPNAFAQYKINDKTTFGMGAYVPYGLATDYENGWFGESHAGLSQVSAVNVSPSLSYQVTDMVAVGGSVNIQHISARLTNTVESNGLYFATGTNDLRGDDLGVGYTLGTTITPRKDIRLGVSYRSKIKHKLEGDVKTSGMPSMTQTPLGPLPTGRMNMKQDIFAKVTTPEVLILSGAYDLNKCFTLSATARWTRWSQFESLDIYRSSDGALLQGTPENWKNTWFYAAGVDYHYDQNWTLRTGLGYDETVIKSPEYRTARIPDGRRVLTSLGLSYSKENWQLDAGYTHIFIHGANGYGKTNGASDIEMKYSSSADLFSLGVQYKF